MYSNLPACDSVTITPKVVWLIDTNIYVYRAWHTKEPATLDQHGHNIHAVRGFLRWLYAFLTKQQPLYIAFAFDEAQTQSFRRSIYPTYKAHRPSMPDNLNYQFKLCREFLAALGFVNYSSNQYEADDIIGTWLTQQASQTTCNIISGDKDLMQLVRDIDYWWDYDKREPLNQGKIKRTMGVWPKQIPDQLALAGDEADNILGINGIGLGTAAKILNKFTSIEVLLMRLPELTQLKTLRYTKVLQERISAQQEQIRTNKQLTRIYCQVPTVPQDLKRQPIDITKLQVLCEQIGLSKEQYEMWQAI